MSSSGSAPRVQAALSLLRNQHERVTRARQAVIEVLDGTQEHLAAEEIVARAESSAPGVHRATVYRALSTLGELGLVTHTHVGGSATVYHLSVPEPADHAASAPHAHLQCTNCQAVIDHPRGCPGLFDQPRRSRGWLPRRATSCCSVGALRRLPQVIPS